MKIKKSVVVTACLTALSVVLLLTVTEHRSFASIDPPPPDSEGPEINLQPSSNPNCLSTAGDGLAPVAILGSASFDVTTIDASTVTFGGAAAVRCNIEDVSPHEGDDPDGFDDLVCHFRRSDLDGLVPAGGCVELTLAAETTTDPIEATDTACGPPCSGADPGN